MQPDHSYHSENTAAPLCVVNDKRVGYDSIAGLSVMLGLGEGGAQMVDDAEAVRAHSDTHLLDNAASTASGLIKYECDFNGLKVERFNAYKCIFIAG